MESGTWGRFSCSGAKFCPHTLPYVTYRISFDWVVWEPDLQSTGHGFKSRPPHCQVQPWTSCLHTCASITKQHNLVPVNGQWCSAAGEVTAGLAESNGSLPPGLWLQSPARWRAKDRDQLWNPMPVSSKGPTGCANKKQSPRKNSISPKL